jgi:hypothetical protein
MTIKSFNKSYKVLVLTCYVGEAEINENIKSTNAQKSVTIYQNIISFKTKYEAHLELYNFIKNNLQNYDYFLKLDADMIIESDVAIISMCKLIDKLSVNRLSFPVIDSYTGNEINGVHLLRSMDLVLKNPNDQLRTDDWISKINGKSFSTSKHVNISHGRLFTKNQAVRFTAQRVLKALADGRYSGHWFTLYLLVCNVHRNRNEEKFLYIASTMDVLFNSNFLTKNSDNYAILDVDSLMSKKLIHKVEKSIFITRFNYISLLITYWKTYRSLLIVKLIIVALLGNFMSKCYDELLLRKYRFFE